MIFTTCLWYHFYDNESADLVILGNYWLVCNASLASTADTPRLEIN